MDNIFTTTGWQLFPMCHQLIKGETVFGKSPVVFFPYKEESSQAVIICQICISAIPIGLKQVHSLGPSINQIFENQQNFSSHIVYLSLNLNHVYFFLVLGHSFHILQKKNYPMFFGNYSALVIYFIYFILFIPPIPS